MRTFSGVELIGDRMMAVVGLSVVQERTRKSELHRELCELVEVEAALSGMVLSGGRRLGATKTAAPSRVIQ